MLLRNSIPIFVEGQMARPSIFSYGIEDIEGTKTTMVLYVNFDGALTTVDQLITKANLLATDLDKLTDGRIYEVVVKIPTLPASGIKTAITVATPVEKTGLFNVSQANTSYVSPVDIPAIALSKITSGHINLTDLEVEAFFTDYFSTIGTVNFVSKFGNQVLALLDAAITFRKHRRQLIKESFEKP